MRISHSEKGYTLLFVLVTLSVLSVLALATIGISLQSSRLTEIRETDITVNQDAKNKLKEALLQLDAVTMKFDSNALFQLISKPTEFQPLLGNKIKIIDQFNQEKAPTNEVLLLWNKQQDNNVLKTLDLYIVSTIQKGDQPRIRKTYSQRVYLSAIPNFLYYVLGSSSKVTLQGSPYITGNIYSKQPLKVTATPDFRYKEVDDSLSETRKMYRNISAHPYVNGKIKVSTNEKSLLHCSDFLECQDTSNHSKVFRASGKTQLLAINDQFIDFDYLFSLNDFLSLPSPYNFHDGTLENVQSQLSTALSQNNFIPYIPKGFLDDLSKEKLVKSKNGEPVTIASNISTSLSSNAPLIIDGDLNIYSTGTSENPLIVSRPLIVNGDLLIQGHVEFSSIIFSLGKSTLQDAVIQKPQNSTNSLVLLSKGPVLINRINSFKPIQNSTANPLFDLEAFIYSDSPDITKIFGVGSTLSLKGGIFTKGELELNAYRGTFSKNDFTNRNDLIVEMVKGEQDDPATFKSDNADRLQLDYDASVLKSAGIMPKNKYVQLFVESPKIQIP
ncbi:hypothetical protein AS033_03220 [Exiguobacterium indicum]|uniref:Uncharacterized protein n=1 Tax=Exiguobacterium indicum TaxID=296995 RepID=A0A0V8GJU3_9BACL|nr:type II secretion system protein [Exiguobacterium enclense]KSU50406.1 hypothetical protein AS033_03220 [Exiguobacterium enclense]SDB93629.1 Type II secretory pathway, pseudopilin PulG [Exiguobacterium enclense]